MFTIRKSRLLIKLVSIVVALVFVFSTYLFLPVQLNYQPIFPSQSHAVAKTFSQNDWTGGVDAGPHVVNWTSDNWNKYTSITNVDVSSGDAISTAIGAILISSVFDLGSTERTVSPGFSFSDEVNVSVRGANTSGGVSSASWQNADVGACLLSYRYIQYKLDFPAAGREFYGIDFYGTDFSINGGVKSSSGNDIEGALVQVIENGVSTTNEEKSSKGGPYIGYNTFWQYHNGDATSYTVKASKSGYNSQTKTASYNIGSCVTWSTLNFSLTPISSGSGSSSGSESSSNVDENPTTDTDSITKVKLPSTFTQEGSKTTDLSKIKDPKKVTGLVLDVVGKGTIKFNETVDLSANKTIAAFEKLNDYLKVQNGIVNLNSKTLSALNKKATITMYKLKHKFTPEVLVDGKKDAKGVVKNLKYDTKTGTLTFDVDHFSKFEAAAKFEIISPASSEITDSNTVVKVKVSDPETTVTGSFNGVELARMAPDKETGEFTLEKLSFNQGENTLKLSGKSKLGAVASLTVKFIFGQEVPIEKPDKTKLLINVALGTLIFLGLAATIGYLVYKKRKTQPKAPKSPEDSAPLPQTEPK